MAGLSSRFFKQGYKQPKYKLIAHGETLFAHSVKSFKEYFDDEYFLFIIRDVYETKNFVEKEVINLGIKKYSIVALDCETRGQAETVRKGVELCSQDITYELKKDIIIFNIDTFRPEFRKPYLELLGDGYLEVFKGSGTNWSFARPLSSSGTKVIETAEKNPISQLCSTGLYHFKSWDIYEKAYSSYLNTEKSNWVNGELYIAPLYNELIKLGYEIHYNEIDRKDVTFCGVPSEYEEFKNARI